VAGNEVVVIIGKNLDFDRFDIDRVTLHIVKTMEKVSGVFVHPFHTSVCRRWRKTRTYCYTSTLARRTGTPLPSRGYRRSFVSSTIGTNACSQ
jgi:hypothetical protein